MFVILEDLIVATRVNAKSQGSVRNPRLPLTH